MNCYLDLLPTIKKAVKRTLNGKYLSDMEDLVQDIFIKVIEKASMHDGSKGSMYSWVYVLSVNHVKDYFDKINRNRVVTLEESYMHIVQDELGLDEIQFEKILNKVLGLLEGFSDADRAIVVDKYLNGVKDHELSPRIGIPTNQIPVYRKRLKERILKEIKVCCHLFRG